MPKATAVWLLENTSLTFKQISEFCELHILEIESMANGEVVGKMPGINPINSKILTNEQIQKCEKNPKSRLKIHKTELPKPKKIAKGAKYTPISKRHERPSAIIWLIKKFPDITNQEICKLLRTTKHTVESIRNKTHWNIENFSPKDPLKLGLCSQKEMEKINKKYPVQETENDENNNENVTASNVNDENNLD